MWPPTRIINSHMNTLHQGSQANLPQLPGLPPCHLSPRTVTKTVTKNIFEICTIQKGWNCLSMGLAFPEGLPLSKHISFQFQEERIYHINPYRVKELVQNPMVPTFATRIFGPIWKQENI